MLFEYFVVAMNIAITRLLNGSGDDTAAARLANSHMGHAEIARRVNMSQWRVF